MSGYLTSRINSVSTDWAFEQSDHASLVIKMKINTEIVKGPGLTRINEKILDDPDKLNCAKNEIRVLMQEVPIEWDPHMRLEYLKVTIRSVITSLVGRSRKGLKEEIKDRESELNDMKNLKQKACSLAEEEIRTRKNNLIDRAIEVLQSDLSILRERQSAETAFRSKANWYEFGEKSNKYFLNLNKKFVKQKLIDHIVCNSISYRGQKRVSEGITDFYQDLYKHVDNQPDNDDGFYDNCPSLSQPSSQLLDGELTQAELLTALNTCSDSAPGSDGITYGVYKKLWDIAGPVILDAWKYSCEKGVMPPSHKESVITLLPKEGKKCE